MRRGRAAPSTDRAASSPPQPAAPPTAATDHAAATSADPAAGERAALREALLRGSAGCADAARRDMTREAKAACDERRGLAAREAPPLGLAMEPGKQARLEAVGAGKRRWRRYAECETGPACEALYPGHLTAALRLLGAQ